MDVIKINDVFSQEDFNQLLSNFKPTPEDNINFSISKELGRFQFAVTEMNNNILIKLSDIVNSVVDYECESSSVTGCEYNIKYGQPSLPPHFDGDWKDLIINYQLMSNTQWDIGVDFNLYQLEDNSAVIFHPNENIHWRPKKNFKDGEFVRMIFFRFQRVGITSDYSHLNQYWPDNDIFKDINNFRNSVSESN